LERRRSRPDRDEHSSGSSECAGLDYHLLNVFALGTLEHAEVETHAMRHDAREHHMSTASWADGALDVNVDAFGQEMGFWHDASSRKRRRERNTLGHRYVPVSNAVIKQLWVLKLRFAGQY
jgi:hypothetical protein